MSVWDRYKRPCLFGGLLGVTLGICDIYPNDWRFWLITIFANFGFVWASKENA